VAAQSWAPGTGNCLIIITAARIRAALVDRRLAMESGGTVHGSLLIMTNTGGIDSGNAPGMIKPPIIVYELEAPDYYFFDSIEQAERYLESPDIWDEAYIIYDAEGYRIIPEVQGLPPRRKRWWPCQKIYIDPVLLRKRSKECYADELRQLLIAIIPGWLEYLEERYGYSKLSHGYRDPSYLQQLPLSELVRTARNLYAVFEEINARRLKRSLGSFALALLLSLVVWVGLLTNLGMPFSSSWSIVLLVVIFCCMRAAIKLCMHKFDQREPSLSQEGRTLPGSGIGRHRPWERY
jgi:hypothetical protein